MTRPSTLRRLGLSVAVLAFTAGGLTACGGDDDTAADSGSASSSSPSASADAGDSDDSDNSGDSGDAADAPDDVSVDDFCGAYSDYFAELQKAGNGTDLDVGTIKDFAEKLSELGTPADIPADARNGFEVSIDAAADLPDDASSEDLASLQSDVSADDQADAMAFGQYVVKTCPDLLAGLGASPSAS